MPAATETVLICVCAIEDRIESTDLSFVLSSIVSARVRGAGMQEEQRGPCLGHVCGAVSNYPHRTCNNRMLQQCDAAAAAKGNQLMRHTTPCDRIILVCTEKDLGWLAVCRLLAEFKRFSAVKCESTNVQPQYGLNNA